MNQCSRLTSRRRWCHAPALPGRDVCRHHADTPEPLHHFDVYRAADVYELNRR